MSILFDKYKKAADATNTVYDRRPLHRLPLIIYHKKKAMSIKIQIILLNLQHRRIKFKAGY